MGSLTSTHCSFAPAISSMKRGAVSGSRIPSCLPLVVAVVVVSAKVVLMTLLALVPAVLAAVLAALFVVVIMAYGGRGRQLIESLTYHSTSVG